MSPTDQSTNAGALLREATAHGRWRLDPAASRADFYVKHFWGAVTVHGWFERLEGEGTVTPEGGVTGRLTIDAASLQTKNGQRDKHLRSGDFFDVDRHPQVVFEVTQATPNPDGTLALEGTLEAAGYRRPITLTAAVEEATESAATLRGEVTVDRTQFDMTWSPLRMASTQARLSASLRFARAAE
jgi:polyisoprenoid-binding protein YceI